MDWMIVRDSFSRQQIGAVGFMGDELVTIVAFYEDKDANRDGKISIGERLGSILFSMRGRAVAEVICQAYADPDIAIRDPNIVSMRGKVLTDFASGMVIEGVYQAWFAAGIGKVAGGVANAITSSTIKSFFIKKGMETAVKQAYLKSMGR